MDGKNGGDLRKCPECGSSDTNVSRTAVHGGPYAVPPNMIRRIRNCAACSASWPTLEGREEEINAGMDAQRVLREATTRRDVEPDSGKEPKT